jgi:hypothetical protein
MRRGARLLSVLGTPTVGLRRGGRPVCVNPLSIAVVDREKCLLDMMKKNEWRGGNGMVFSRLVVLTEGVSWVVFCCFQLASYFGEEGKEGAREG